MEKGVTEEEIPIVGEVWRNLEVGGIRVDSQRFCGKKDGYPNHPRGRFLGAFWGVSLDFRGGKLRVNEETELPLKETYFQPGPPDHQVS